MAGLEPTISESKSGVLPLHYIPPSTCAERPALPASRISGVGDGARTHDTRNHNPVLIPTELHPPFSEPALARQEGLEPPAYCLEGSCSILLSYWRISRRKTPGSKQCHAPSKALLVYHPRPGLSRGICNFPGENRHAAQFFCASASRRRISRVRTRAAATARMTSATSWA